MADIYPVDPQFAAKARIDKKTYEQQYRASVADPDGFWGKAAERLQWMRKPTKIKNVSYDLSDFRIKWFEDGELNASVNCPIASWKRAATRPPCCSSRTARMHRPSM